MPQGLVGGKIWFDMKCIGQRGARVVRRQKHFHEREGNFEGTSFRLIDLKRVCFSRWVQDHVYSRDVALPWLRTVITAHSIISLSIELQPKISEIRKVVVVTPGTFGE